MSEALALEHRQALDRLTTLTARELNRFLRTLDTADAIVIREALMDVVPTIGNTYGDMAGALAADYYEDARDLAAAPGLFVAEPAPLPGTARYEALVRWGVDPLFQPEPDQLLAFSKLAGGLQRIVGNVARDTVADNSLRDPQAEGWRRVTRSDACKFCQMLAGRGAVYSESTVRFASHDHCNCAAAPAFEPGRQLSVEQYVASKRTPTDADRARVREFLRNMDG